MLSIFHIRERAGRLETLAALGIIQFLKETSGKKAGAFVKMTKAL